MNFKRNIFESGAKMPKWYQSSATPMTVTDENKSMPFTLSVKPDSSVRHAPIPRIGEQK